VAAQENPKVIPVDDFVRDELYPGYTQDFSTQPFVAGPVRPFKRRTTPATGTGSTDISSAPSTAHCRWLERNRAKSPRRPRPRRPPRWAPDPCSAGPGVAVESVRPRGSARPGRREAARGGIPDSFGRILPNEVGFTSVPRASPMAAAVPMASWRRRRRTCSRYRPYGRGPCTTCRHSGSGTSPGLSKSQSPNQPRISLSSRQRPLVQSGRERLPGRSGQPDAG
jgi:hypothetical protein